MENKPRIIAMAGPSGTGKTTTLVQRIRECVARGERVGAIKHTHHALNEENRGDTARFREAGAEPVILAGNGEAVIFRASGIERIVYADPDELLRYFDADVIVIEGFKDIIWRQ